MRFFKDGRQNPDWCIYKESIWSWNYIKSVPPPSLVHEACGVGTPSKKHESRSSVFFFTVTGSFGKISVISIGSTKIQRYELQKNNSIKVMDRYKSIRGHSGTLTLTVFFFQRGHITNPRM